MKRWTIRTLLVLILGVVTTVVLSGIAVYAFDPFASRYESGFYLDETGVNWYFQLNPHFWSVGVKTTQRWPLPPTSDLIDVHASEVGGISIDYPSRGSFSHTPNPDWFFDASTVQSSPLPPWSRARRREHLNDNLTWGREHEISHERAYGWPFFALRHERIITRARELANEPALYPRFSPLEILEAPGFRPIFPGFIINTLFYAANWFGIFFAVGFAKRTIRKKRGRCLMCNYDLRGGVGDVKGCPECGWNREP